MKAKFPWIHSAALDVTCILGPPFAVLGLVIAFPQWFGPEAVLTELHWIALVLLIDVAHVYSTIYRTYMDREAVRTYRFELIGLPLIALGAMVLLHTLSMQWFWRCMAYLAIFHFVRQQYGFMRLYARKDNVPRWKHRLDGVTVYAATLAPLLHWHLSYPRRFDWFVANDMLGAEVPWAAQAVLIVYGMLLLVHVGSEVHAWRSGQRLNLPKNLLIAGTALSWYMGIVHFNGDVTFTLFNVVSHGVPYMALVWAYGRGRSRRGTGMPTALRALFSLKAVPVYLMILFVLAYVEEGFWSALVWGEHTRTFPLFAALPQVTDAAVLSVLVPLLSLPQVTHYIIDAFIWRMRKDRDQWQRTVFGAGPQP